MKKFALYLFIGLVIVSCNKEQHSSNQLALSNNVEQLIPRAQDKITNWPAYVAFDKNMRIISNTNSLNAIGLMDELANNVNAMAVQVPPAFDTKNVLDKLEQVDLEVRDFYIKVDRDELRERVAERHVKDILLAFDDLNKAINSCVNYKPKNG